MACHHGNIHVSIPPDFWVWGSLKAINGGSWGVFHCHPNSSKTWYRVHTTFNDPLRIVQHRHGMSPWQHLCEYTPRFLSLRVLESYKWWQLRWMKVLHCHPNSSKTWYRVHTTFNDPLRIIQHHHGMSPWQHLCEYTPRFLSLRGPWKL